jgi:hypothetical protein
MGTNTNKYLKIGAGLGMVLVLASCAAPVVCNRDGAYSLGVSDGRVTSFNKPDYAAVCPGVNPYMLSNQYRNGFRVGASNPVVFWTPPPPPPAPYYDDTVNINVFDHHRHPHHYPYNPQPGPQPQPGPHHHHHPQPTPPAPPAPPQPSKPSNLGPGGTQQLIGPGGTHMIPAQPAKASTVLLKQRGN